MLGALPARAVAHRVGAVDPRATVLARRGAPGRCRRRFSPYARSAPGRALPRSGLLRPAPVEQQGPTITPKKRPPPTKRSVPNTIIRLMLLLPVVWRGLTASFIVAAPEHGSRSERRTPARLRCSQIPMLDP